MAMNPTQVRDVLTRRYRRGFLILRSIWGISMVSAACVYFLLPCGIPWAIVSWLVGMPFYFWSTAEAARSYALALTVYEDPAIVYWAQPVDVPAALRHRNWFRAAITGMRVCDKGEESVLGLTAGASGVWEFLHLHLRDGSALELRLLRSQLRDFMAWLSEANPSLRVGIAFDVADETRGDERKREGSN